MVPNTEKDIWEWWKMGTLLHNQTNDNITCIHRNFNIDQGACSACQMEMAQVISTMWSGAQGGGIIKSE